MLSIIKMCVCAGKCDKIMNVYKKIVPDIIVSFVSRGWKNSHTMSNLPF